MGRKHVTRHDRLPPLADRRAPRPRVTASTAALWKTRFARQVESILAVPFISRKANRFTKTNIPGPARKQMSNCAIEVAPHFSVLVADKEQTFSRRIGNILSIIGFNNIILKSDPHECFKLAYGKIFDIAFVDMDAAYDPFWNNADQLDILIVGMTYDKNARTWMSAIRRGADAILLKQYHPELLRPMLSQLVSSPRAWRGRLVQFPNTPSMRALTRSNERPGTNQPSSSSGETG